MSRRRVFGVLTALTALILAWWLLREEPPRAPARPSQLAARPEREPRARPSSPATRSTPREARPAAPPAQRGRPASPTPSPVVGGDDGTPTPEAAPRLIRIRVEDDDGRPVERAMVQSMDCGFVRTTFSAEVEVVLPPGVERCTVRAGRRDGMLWNWSEYEEVEPGTEATLFVPTEPLGGMGIQVAEHERGIAVQGVVPGTPAARAGLGPGDVVVEVDGVEASDISLDDFIALGTGPVGSRVQLVVGRYVEGAWEEEPVTLTRAFLDSPR